MEGCCCYCDGSCDATARGMVGVVATWTEVDKLFGIMWLRLLFLEWLLKLKSTLDVRCVDTYDTILNTIQVCVARGITYQSQTVLGPMVPRFSAHFD